MQICNIAESDITSILRIRQWNVRISDLVAHFKCDNFYFSCKREISTCFSSTFGPQRNLKTWPACYKHAQTVKRKKYDSLSARSLLFGWPRESKSNDPILISKSSNSVSSRRGIRSPDNRSTSLFDTFHNLVSRERRLIDDRAGTMSTTRAHQGRKTSRTDPAGGELRTDKASASVNSSVDRSVPLKSRPTQSTTATTSATTPTARDNPAVRKSSGRRMSNNNEPGSATVTAVEKRDERIARYKEERRKQLQAARQQAGLATGTAGHDHSSSSEDLPHEEQSYAKYKHRKQMQKQQLESRPLEESTTANIVSDVTNSNLSSTGIKRFIKRESPLTSEENNGAAPVRINRAARLRAAATSGTPPPVEDKLVVQRAKRLSVPLMEMPAIDPSGDPVDASQPAVVVLRQKLPSSSSSSSLQAGNREKDKSTKRKSNLNRALTDEQILATGQIESQEDAGKRVRRRRTADLTVSASSAETDINSSVDNAMIRRMETASRQSPQPAADLRANLRKTSQPPAFIRPAVPEVHNNAGGENAVPATAVESSSSSSAAAHSSVPWRTGKVASADKAMEPIKTEDLTARIEALTAMAHQTVAKVDRLTATPDRESNGAHPAVAGGSVKAVASKLLNRVANIQPTTPVSPNLPVSLPRRPAKIESPNVCVNSNSSPAVVKLLPAAACTQQQQTQSISKNKPAIHQADKAAAASPAGVAGARANTANASALGRSKTADKEKTQSKPVEPVGNTNSTSGPSSSVKAVQGILKKKVEGGAEPSVVRIRPEVSPPELYPILRVEEEVVTQLDPVSILKKRFEADAETLAVPPVPAEASVEPHSILKRPLSRDGSAESARSQSPVVDPINSILKRASLTSSPGTLAPDQASCNSEPRPILKKRCSTEDGGADGPRPILKKKSSTEEEHELAAHKPILKSGRRTSQITEAAAHVAAREAETTDDPEEESRTEVEEEEPRQLSIAERISSIESHANPPPAVAPWRLPSRPNPSSTATTVVPASVDFGAESISSRRKSLEHVIESNRTAGLVEAVNRHVVEAHAHSNGADSAALIKPDIEVLEDEHDPSKLSLRERVKLFDRPLFTDGLPPKRPGRPNRKIFARFQTQPVTSREVKNALHLGFTRRPSSTKAVVPAREVIADSPVVKKDAKPEEVDDQDETGASGLERIRGILRRKSTDNTMEMRGILRSKSPSIGEQPKSILKHHSPDVDETEQLSPSTSSSDEFPVPAENDLAAQLLNVEMESKHPHVSADVQPPSNGVNSKTDSVVPETPTPKSNSSPNTVAVQQSSVRRETETIILESEGSSSGTETTTTVTFRLGGNTAGTVQQSQTKIKSHKIKTKMEEVSDSSVASRLAALQKSGDTEWRKRISKPVVGSPSAGETDEATNSDGDIPTKSSIADRLKVLETAQKGWRTRVHEPDAARFTVAGKMGQRPVSVHVLSSEMIKHNPISPMLDRKLKTPKPVPLRLKNADGSAVSDSSPGTTPSTDDVKPPFNRSTSDPSSTPSRLIIPGTGKITSRIVSVPRPDDETFTSFFAASSWSLATSSQSVAVVQSSASFADITDEDFDRMAFSRDAVVVEKRSVNVQRRKHNTSRNPIKSLILRPDMLRNEYEEVDTGVAEREVQRVKLEKLAQNSHLAVEALAGLASKEDFAAISLKSAKETGEEQSKRTVYLMQVKGRRQIQTRLVEPIYTSVNSGDCYILVTPTDVIQFIGRYANVIERSRSTDVAQRIVSKKDLGSARASHVQLVEEDKVGTNSFYGASKRFWTALGRSEAEQAINPAGPPEEDELYESAIATTNAVWQLSGDRLEPCEQHWGTILQTDILDPNKVMVFDFGSEMYVWSGKMTPLEVRKRAMQLAKELWDQGYDYTECAINPVFQKATSEEQSKGQQRPSWALLRSAKQHMEPVLFREKFFDWPDKSGLIKVKSQDSEEKAVGVVTDISSLEPCDAQLMLDNQVDDPDLELEGAHLGRGVEYYDEAERRLQQISTLSVKVWHLQDYEKVLMDEVSRGQFHSRDTYIIRWQYRITVTGKDLKGQPSVHGLLGRDRFCYFIWHGAQAPPTDQGASALKTVELDEERGPHVRVQQGHEPPAFLAIFQGRMAIHSGKRGEREADQSVWRLYFMRGEKEEEAHLVQVRRCVQALRSRGCLLLVNQSTGTVFVWHGAKSLKHTRQVANFAASALKQHRPPELNVRSDANMTIKEQYEGAESREFWEGLGHNSRVADRSLYLSLAERPKENRYDYTPRLFHLTSWTGQFRAQEMAPALRAPQLPCPYPFVQEDLYGANQPTLFMLDNEHEVWLWQGWWPDLPDTDNTNTGSGKLRLAVERRCAMETVIEYCRLRGDNEDRIPPPAYLVSAGLEPLAFTALFPYWTADERVAQLSIQDGKSSGESQSIRDVLDRLKRTTYPLSELQVRPPPEGVDPTKLESYLTDDDFQETMGMSKTEFYALPAWRQTQLRKETGLF
ncbi:hypothetical protein GHT06_010634 [Daphnia sinensis]|uniref:HP domain-containing protein n=1 Tax=Daphnia sinensis TaxID=1820382 RepID=A0AAD5PX51_9CRUS|nr:hypothetical protein GHT06_010634 [Daphnia sinensis]